MEKWRRSERLILLTKELLDQPHHLFSLGEFSERYQAAKSSISEDLTIIKDTLQKTGQGDLISVAGVSGGVKYLPYASIAREKALIAQLVEKLTDPSRILPGGFIYMLDVIYDPAIITEVGKIFARHFAHTQPDYIVTVETKGIPMGAMTARAFNVPLVIIRNDNRVTEGSAMSINYVSGSSHKISTMTLARRAIKTGTKVIIIDDFMKAGGTAKGMVELMHEFKVDVLGIGVLISTAQPEKKLVDEYISLLELVDLDQEMITIRSAHHYPEATNDHASDLLP